MLYMHHRYLNLRNLALAYPLDDELPYVDRFVRMMHLSYVLSLCEKYLKISDTSGTSRLVYQ